MRAALSHSRYLITQMGEILFTLFNCKVNAPVFIFTKHASGWWTGECKGKYLYIFYIYFLIFYSARSYKQLTQIIYGLFPSNFVVEEFQVTLRPKLEVHESENQGLPVIPSGGTAESLSEGSDDDTQDSEGVDQGEEEEDEQEGEETTYVSF